MPKTPARPPRRPAARAAAARARAEQIRQNERRRTLAVRTGVAVAALALVGGTVALVPAQGGHSSAAAAEGIPKTPITTASGAATAPPWAAPADAAARIRAAGLPALGTEGQAMHIHAHLDVIVDGGAVTVPADIGIDTAHNEISPLHTHDTSGVIHVESPVTADFTLAQFMTEWNVRLSATTLGSLTTGDGKQLKVYVNGRERGGDPGALALHDHDEIALVHGDPNARTTVPSGYAWPSGL